MTRSDPLHPLLLLGADQQHIVTRAQLRSLGVPPGTIARRLRPGGPRQRVLPRVIRLQSGRLTAHRRLRAAVAYAAEGPGRTGRRSPADRGGGARRRRTAVRRAGLGELLDQLLAGPAVPRLPHVAQVVEDLAAGVRSVVEGEARGLVLGAGLPEPLWNPVLLLDGRFLAVPDAYWPQACVALEIDPRAWHLRPADHERSLTRANRFTAAGLPVVRTTPVQLRRDPAPVLGELAALLATGPHGPHARISRRRAR
ncbi:hypothetical protein OH807_14175 [Kitasatospora sp. NBC_01560]|uniref:hypothetical protein n=1 Tax=Kitasatospora sp. NBC_01560 TaxID=2975965 RepID=UPI0038669618